MSWKWKVWKHATQTIDFVDTETELKWKIDREYTDTTSYAGSMQKNISF